MGKRSNGRRERTGRPDDELVVPSTGTRIPLPDDASDDEVDDLVLSHPELIARAARARRERRAKPEEEAPSGVPTAQSAR